MKEAFQFNKHNCIVGIGGPKAQVLTKYALHPKRKKDDPVVVSLRDSLSLIGDHKIVASEER